MNSLKPLFTLLQKTLFVEQRRCGFGKFFDGSKSTKGHQALQNRLAYTKEVIEPRLDRILNDDAIRILTKKSFFNDLVPQLQNLNRSLEKKLCVT